MGVRVAFYMFYSDKTIICHQGSILPLWWQVELVMMVGECEEYNGKVCTAEGKIIEEKDMS